MHQQALYEKFRDLHFRKGGFIMPNAWDGTSALLIKEAGFDAIATSSAAYAFSIGCLDGNHEVSREEEIDNAKLIGRLSGLPVNGDFEDGFGPLPNEVALTVEAAIAAGLAGIGIEDTTANPEHPIHDFDHAVRRMEAAARVAKGRIMLTGRTDNYLYGINDLDDTIRRLTAFAEAGADVLYAPALPDMDAIQKVLKAVAPKPVNILIGPAQGAVPISDLQSLGVHRISLGGSLYRHAMAKLNDALTMLTNGNIAAAATGIAHGQITEMVKKSRA